MESALTNHLFPLVFFLFLFFLLFLFRFVFSVLQPNACSSSSSYISHSLFAPVSSQRLIILNDSIPILYTTNSM